MVLLLSFSKSLSLALPCPYCLPIRMWCHGQWTRKEKSKKEGLLASIALVACPVMLIARVLHGLSLGLVLSFSKSLCLSQRVSLSLWPCLVHIVFLSAHWPCLVHIAFLSGCGIMKRIADGKLAIVACLAMLIARVLQCLSLCLFLSFSISLSLKKNLAWHCPALALFISCFCRTFFIIAAWCGLLQFDQEIVVFLCMSLVYVLVCIMVLTYLCWLQDCTVVFITLDGAKKAGLLLGQLIKRYHLYAYVVFAW